MVTGILPDGQLVVRKENVDPLREMPHHDAQVAAGLGQGHRIWRIEGNFKNFETDL